MCSRATGSRRTLRAAYGLAEALVVPDGTGDPGATVYARVTRAAADWLPRLLAPGDRLGVSWGETVHQMAQLVPRQPIEDLTVVQLLGSRPAERWASRPRPAPRSWRSAWARAASTCTCR